MSIAESNELLREILKWQKLQGMNLLRELMPTLLADEKQKMLYEMTDGKNSQTIIAKKVRVSTGTVSNWWKTWYSYGILTKAKGNRYEKIFSLKDFGF